MKFTVSPLTQLVLRIPYDKIKRITLGDQGWTVVRGFQAWVVLSLLWIGVGCTNNLNDSTIAARTSVDSGTPTLGLGQTASGTQIMNLRQVIRNQYDPSGTLDLIGDSSGMMGQVCLANGSSGSSASAAGSSTCECEIDFTTPSGQHQNFRTATTYLESNLLRCKIGTLIPAGTPFLKVRVHLKNADLFSNTVTMPLTTTGLDTTDAANFMRVTRFQCRDRVQFGYLFDSGSIYDPILSDHPAITYPLNFYTTNMGGTFARIPRQQGMSLWNCPSTPNDTQAGLDLTLFSVSPDPAGSKLIHPPIGSANDRSTFFVAKKSAGVFTVPLNAYILPGVRTQTVDNTGVMVVTGTGTPQLGFAAAPVPAGSGKETCPESSVAIPSGFKWAKLWLFRADLPKRRYPFSAKFAAMGAIACNPGMKDKCEDGSNPDTASGGCFASGSTSSLNPAVTWNPVFPDCNTNSTVGMSMVPRGGYIPDVSGNLADRVLVFGSAHSCYRLRGASYNGFTFPCLSENGRSSDGPGCTTRADGITQFSGYEQYASGTDIWVAAQGSANLGGSSSSVGADPLNIKVTRVPADSSPSSIELDTESNPRFDYLLVVSPPSVMAADMANSTSPVRLVYTPYRYMSPTDCKSPDPDNPLTTGDCPVARRINYGIKWNEIGVNADAADSLGSRGGIYPMCVLQPTGGS
jgi:hypothetical protein